MASQPLTAEDVAIDIIANTDGLTRTTKQAASDFGADMNRIKTSADQAESAVTSANVRMARAMQATTSGSRGLGIQLGQIGSQLAVGTSPFVIMAQQASDLAIVLDGTGGAIGRVARFFTSWQGALLLAAGTIAATVLPKLFEFGDELDDEIKKLQEHADKADLAKRAQEAFGNTIAGVTAKLRENREELDKLNQAQATSAERALSTARDQLQESVKHYEDQIANLERIRAQIAFSIANPPQGQFADAAQAGRLNYLERQLERVQRQIAEARKNRDEARQQVAQAQSFVIVEQAIATQEERINRQYDERIDKARQLAVQNGTVETTLRRQVEAINAAREAELKRIRDAERARQQSGSGLPPVTRDEVARALGAPIISGQRSAAHNKRVGGSANSFHLGGPTAAVQAIDIPLTVNGRPLSKESIRAMLEPLGVVIRELLGPGDKNHDDHFHVAFERRRVGADKIAENQQRAAEEAERARQAEERRRQTFENELAGLLDDEIAARQALITSAEEINRLELQAIEISRQRYNDNLSSLIEQKKLTDEEAAQLREINDERARLRTELVKRREQERVFRVREAELQRQATFESEQRAIAAELLQGQSDLADTQAQRREIERRLLDLQFREERARNDYLIAFYDRLKLQEGISESELAEARAAAEIAALRNESLEARRSNAQASSDRRTAGPLESMLESVPDTAAEINEALESIAAGGLATFTDALTDAIVNFRSLGDVGLAVLQNLTAGLVKLALQQIILKAIGATAGTSAIGATGAQASAAAAAWAPAAALASLATLGSNAGPAALALGSTNALAQALAATSAIARKDGGPINGPGGPRDDRILVAASNGEYMIRAGAARKLGRAALDRMNLTGELPYGFAGGGPIGNAPVIPSARPAMRGGSGEATLSEESVNRLARVVSEAASAMPPVNLFPTLDPGRALREALATPGGSRAMFDFLSDNSGKANAAINR